MKGVQIIYTAEQLAWVEEQCYLPRAELHDRFQRQFARPDISKDALKALCQRKGWKTGRTGCFPKGNVPANKGKKMPFNANSAATQFKKGMRQGVAEKLYKPIGTERLSKDGYLERKIHDGLPLQSRWRAVHLIEWEAINGPLPDGHCLKCIDGDRRNVAPDNWECIPRSMLPRLSGRWGQHYDTAPDAVKPTLMTMAKIEQRVRTLNKKAADR